MRIYDVGDANGKHWHSIANLARQKSSITQVKTFIPTSGTGAKERFLPLIYIHPWKHNNHFPASASPLTAISSAQAGSPVQMVLRLHEFDVAYLCARHGFIAIKLAMRWFTKHLRSRKSGFLAAYSNGCFQLLAFLRYQMSVLMWRHRTESPAMRATVSRWLLAYCEEELFSANYPTAIVWLQLSNIRISLKISRLFWRFYWTQGGSIGT